MRTLYIKSYHHDEDDIVIQITEEVYEQLLPYSDDLRRGNGASGIDEDVWEEWWNDWFKFGKPMLKSADFSFDIQIANC